MENKQELTEQLNWYKNNYTDEHVTLEHITHFIQLHEGEDLYSRKNFMGHITASAFILNTSCSSVLLLHHRSLNKWLQPGGHVDVSDASLLHAAIREASEETGIDTNFLTVMNETIFDIDSHYIPPNSRKNEPEHYHHDVRFLFVCNNSNTITIAADESIAFEWVPLSEFYSIDLFLQVGNKIKTALANNLR